MLVFPPGRLLLGRVCLFFIDEPLQLFLLDKSFYLLLQVIAVGCIVTVITVEMTIFVFGRLAKVSLQLAKERQGSFIFDLHQDLINWGI